LSRLAAALDVRFVIRIDGSDLALDTEPRAAAA
jgi:hypothetical protein